MTHARLFQKKGARRRRRIVSTNPRQRRTRLTADLLQAMRDRFRIRLLSDVKRKEILRAVFKANGDSTLAAFLLGIGRTTIYHALKRYAVQKLGTAMKRKQVAKSRRKLAKF